jgi:hypothetical protein
MQAFLAAVAAFVGQIQAVAVAYRLLVLSVVALVTLIAATWAFVAHPQALIVVELAVIATYAYGPRLVAWVRGET